MTTDRKRKGAARGEPVDSTVPARAGIKSLEAAISVLQILAAIGRPASLTELAKLTRMPPSKIHRYLASFMRTGLVVQRQRSGQYDLGKRVLELGLAAMSRIEILNRAADRLEEITQRTNAAALLAVWGTQGPTIVRWQRIQTVIVSSLGLGTTFPLLNSATGRIFLAYSASSLVAPILDFELKRARSIGMKWPDLEPTEAGVRKLCKVIREKGYATADGKFVPGLYAISAPVLNWQNEVEAVITVANGDPDLIDAKGSALHHILSVTRELSIRTPEPLAQ